MPARLKRTIRALSSHRRSHANNGWRRIDCRYRFDWIPADVSLVFRLGYAVKNAPMKTFSFFVVASALLCTATVFADDEANLNRVLGSLNARANLPDGKNYVMATVSRETKVPIKTLAAEQSQTGFGFGELFAAHTIAAAGGRSFQEIAALRLKQRKNWSQI